MPNEFMMIWTIVAVLVALLVVIAIVGATLSDLKMRSNYETHGWYVDATGGADDVSLVYFEKGGGQVCLSGDRQSRTIKLPSEEYWDDTAPDFAKGRFTEIVDRIKASKRNYKFVYSATAYVNSTFEPQKWARTLSDTDQAAGSQG